MSDTSTGAPAPASPSSTLATPLSALIAEHIKAAGGWIGFERYMQLALYTPGLGYYAGGRRKFGLMPESGSDFVTAPELSPLFGRALARQLAQALAATGTTQVYEFGAGSGALAAQLLEALGDQLKRYCIVDLSGELRQRQSERLAPWADKVEWLERLPEAIEGVLIGNEVLDAMPVQLLRWDGRQWLERGVGVDGDGFQWVDRPTNAPQGLDAELRAGLVPGSLVEIHGQAEAFVATLARQLRRGAIFLIDYGFPEREYYHPERSGGTLMCHHLHRADPDPLSLVGDKDITVHINFTGVALAGQDAGLTVLGYTSQANFLINCGLVELLAEADLPTRSMAHKLIAEHEMGELFKVIGFAAGEGFDALGFSAGDRSHML
ncbi:SAM-dependent methyltransferase [Paucibacter sp. APW11]|uniref:SAM-dependent methyltransferase n=1 Tax=Roseateles aquae TaxID=3077235 RepID=A0ABU3PAV8_9BURK|nr:SAM-dependent methyltransferase [Paucibacter sp. APW11]MDT8999650.1 SAM-dependent methyltransferase [Paucibacter sp. APW11]